MRMTIKTLILLFSFCNIVGADETNSEKLQIQHPEWYIKISEFNIYSARGVGIIHHVTIENSADIAYKNLKVRVRYKSRSYTNYGTVVATETGVLPVTLPPNSKKTYLEGGAVLGATSSGFEAGSIEVLSAVPITR